MTEKSIRVARVYRDKCKGCRKCMDVCDAFVLFGGKMILWQSMCTGCRRCVDVCPHDAIEMVKHERTPQCDW